MNDAELKARILKALASQPDDAKREMLKAHAEVREIQKKMGPQTREELYDWFVKERKVYLSTVSVCPGHVSQLDMVWEVYSFQVIRVLWVVNRGGGKTSLAAWLDDCQAVHWPGWESFTIGANKTQGDRKYQYLLPGVVEGGVINGKELPHVQRSTSTKTQYKNGSAIEIALGSSPENANGPRTPRLHCDEIEQMDPETLKQANSIPAGRKMRDGRYAPAQWLYTSTMKTAGGPVDTIMQKTEKAIADGKKPAMEVRISCIFESSQENPACRSVPAEEREARLTELGMDPKMLCDCDQYEHDVWPVEESAEGREEGDQELEDEPRTLESVCQGRFFRSRGHKGFDDIQGLFMANGRDTWNAEHECAEPSREGTYLKSYTHLRHGIDGYVPDPENGDIYQAVDWGTDDEAAVIWVQILDRPVRCRSYIGEGYKLLPVGALVVFAEIFEKGLGNTELGNMVVQREAQWIMDMPGWRVLERFPDSANPGARKDWDVYCNLRTVSRIKKDFGEELKMVRNRVATRGKFFVDVRAAKHFDIALRSWKKKPNGKEVHDHASHPMAAFRYLEHNLNVLQITAKSTGGGGHDTPRAESDEDRTRERETELRQMAPRQRVGEAVVMLGKTTAGSEAEDYGIGAAEDSPLREQGLTMGGERDWRSSFGNHERER